MTHASLTPPGGKVQVLCAKTEKLQKQCCVRVFSTLCSFVCGCACTCCSSMCMLSVSLRMWLCVCAGSWMCCNVFHQNLLRYSALAKTRVCLCLSMYACVCVCGEGVCNCRYEHVLLANKSIRVRLLLYEMQSKWIPIQSVVPSVLSGNNNNNNCCNVCVCVFFVCVCGVFGSALRCVV